MRPGQSVTARSPQTAKRRIRMALHLRGNEMNPFVLGLILFVTGFWGQAGNTSAPVPKWKQINLMRSTRIDVERLLGHSKYRGYSAWYKVDDGVVHIEYYPFNSCTQPGADFNVRRWTVVEITYEPDKPSKLADLNLDLTKFKKVNESPDVPDLTSYVNEEEGVDYTFAADETLNNVRYFPGKRHDGLRCRKQNKRQYRRTLRTIF